MSSAKREENRQVALILTNTLGTNVVYPTGVILTDSTPMHVAIVDGNGDQVTSFGGGTQYADGAARGTATGTIAMVDDGTNIQSLLGDSSGRVFTNISQINAVAPLMGNGTTGTGSLRVTIASDNTAFSVNATLAAETTKVIGTVNQGTSPWVISGAVTNTILSVVGGGTEATAQRVTLASDSTGVLTVKQATAANLNATVVGTGTFAVQATPVTQVDTFMLGGVNIKEINAVAPLMGSGIMGTGSLRVTIASDNDALTIKQATGTNLHMVVDSGTVTTVSTVTTVTTLTGTTTLTPGTAAANLGKAEDAVHGSGDTGVFSLGVANEAQSALAADGDYIAQATDTKGNTLAVGNIAHDGVDAGNPVKVGGKAANAEPAAVANNDRTNLITDLVGKLIVLPYANPENFVSGAITSAMTGTTTTSLIAAPASGLRNYITQITVSNSHATVGTDVIIQDGSGGTTLYTIPAAAVYGGATLTFPVPLRQPSTATAIFCANVTTGANTKVSASGYKGI